MLYCERCQGYHLVEGQHNDGAFDKPRHEFCSLCGLRLDNCTCFITD